MTVVAAAPDLYRSAEKRFDLMKSTRRSRAWPLAKRTGALGETPPLLLILRCESKNYLCPTPRPHTVSHGTTRESLGIAHQAIATRVLAVPESGGLDEFDQDPAGVLGVDEVDPTVRRAAARGVKEQAEPSFM